MCPSQVLAHPDRKAAYLPRNVCLDISLTTLNSVYTSFQKGPWQDGILEDTNIWGETPSGPTRGCWSIQKILRRWYIGGGARAICSWSSTNALIIMFFLDALCFKQTSGDKRILHQNEIFIYIYIYIYMNIYIYIYGFGGDGCCSWGGVCVGGGSSVGCCVAIMV